MNRRELLSLGALAALPGAALAGGLTPAPPALVAGVLQGFRIRWDARPHRLRSLGFGVDLGPAPHGAAAGSLTAHVRGGSWATGERARDVPRVELDYAGLVSPSRAGYRGVARLAAQGRATRDVLLRRPAEARRVVEVPLAAPAEAGAVYLTAFRLDTDAGHPDGFTLHALRIELGPVDVDEDDEGRVVARFDAHLRVEAAAVPDRRQDLEEYGVEVEIGWLLLPGPATGVTRQPLDGRDRRGISLAGDTEVVPRARLPFGAACRGPGAFVGLAGFFVEIGQDGYDSGRYLRELAVQVDDVRVDPFRARCDGELSIVFSNAGDIARPVAVSFGAVVSTLETAAGEATFSGRWSEHLTAPDARVDYPDGVPTGSEAG